MDPTQAALHTANALLTELKHVRGQRKVAKAEYRVQKQIIKTTLRDTEAEIARIKLVNSNTMGQLKQHIAKLRMERIKYMRQSRQQWVANSAAKPREKATV